MLRSKRSLRATSFLVSMALLLVACAVSKHDDVLQHRWWAGLGPVLPHDTFPEDCSLCHVGEGWRTLVDDFEYDHEKETGVALDGSHGRAQCLRCHNDRGPVEVFASQGCVGCHEDLHLGQLGTNCESCHVETTWQPQGMIALHQRSRFPLVGVHTTVSCRRCHPGATVGRFTPTDTECVTCHRDDLQNATNPNHLGLGWVDRCDRCHVPTTWLQAEIND